MPQDLDATYIKESLFSNTDFVKKVPVLTFLSGDQVGRQIMLADDHVVIGRSPDATIMLRDALISRLHITIEYNKQSRSYIARDLQSTNGTFINGKRITESMLHDSDKIVIGNTILRFGWSDMYDIKYHTEIDNLLNLDDLTGLVIKRRFDEELNRYIAVARTKDTLLAMIMIDIDGVKKINDTHGHVYGALTISQTGKLIKTVIGNKGLASRFGGDEFMIFLPNITLDAAFQVAEAIRIQVEMHTFELDGVVVHPTISAGVSSLKKNDSSDTLFRRADEALYMSKRTGRNKVTIVD